MKGKCSVPLWRNGLPAGHCPNDAYGERPQGKTIERWDGVVYRTDGRYAGYVPGLACEIHGGPSLKEVSHKGDPCIFCGTHHDNVAPGSCDKAKSA